jgi:Flp pilus assembly pilin Flp
VRPSRSCLAIEIGKGGIVLTHLMRLVQETRGQNLAEYGICLAVIAVAAGAAAVAIAGNVATIWTTASAIIASAV